MGATETANKTCFVISPIGEAGSEIRKNADELFDLVIKPALKPYNFIVKRADKEVGSNIITKEIIDLVQNSDLCIIDLTGSNANVFYECGRRHETGKPFIQMIRAKEKLPFDVSAIRTINYDLMSLQSGQEAIEQIQMFVEDLIQTGFQVTSSGFSLSNISNTLERIEKKIEAISASGRPIAKLDKKYDSDLGPLEKLKIEADPMEGLKKALETGDLKLADMSLQILYNNNVNPEEYVNWAIVFASLGDRIAYDILKKIISNNDFEITNAKDFEKYIGNFYNAFNKFKEYEIGYNYIIPKLAKYIDEKDVSSDTKFRAYETMALFASGVGKSDEAVSYAEKALVIFPKDEKVLGDLLVYYEKLENFDKAVEVSKKIIDINQYNFDSYLTFENVIINYFRAGKAEEGEDLLAIYQTKFPTTYASFLPILEKYRPKAAGK